METLKTTILNMGPQEGLSGCTYGDTNFDSVAVCYGYNQALEDVLAVVEKYERDLLEFFAIPDLTLEVALKFIFDKGYGPGSNFTTRLVGVIAKELAYEQRNVLISAYGDKRKEYTDLLCRYILHVIDMAGEDFIPQINGRTSRQEFTEGEVNILHSLRKDGQDEN